VDPITVAIFLAIIVAVLAAVIVPVVWFFTMVLAEDSASD
jgi:hypothetical protein